MNLQDNVIIKPAGRVPHRRKEIIYGTPAVFLVGKRTVQIIGRETDRRFIRNLGIPTLGQTVRPELSELVGKPANDPGIELISVVVQERLPEHPEQERWRTRTAFEAKISVGATVGPAVAVVGGTVGAAMGDSAVAASDPGDRW